MKLKKLLGAVLAFALVCAMGVMFVACDDEKKDDGKDETPTVEVTGVTLDKTSLELVQGEEATLVATVAPSDATDKTVTWTTTDAKVAKVENGKVSAPDGVPVFYCLRLFQ